MILIDKKGEILENIMVGRDGWGGMEGMLLKDKRGEGAG